MIRTTLAIFLTSILLLSVTYAQLNPRGASRKKEEVTKTTQEEEEEPVLPPELTIDADILEEAIDPDQYTVGPGDVFEIKVWGGLEQLFIASVSPEGYLSIPTVGDLMVKDSLLSHARKMVENAAEKVYKTGEVTVKLKNLRRFRIPVTGILNYPGVYDVSPIDRVSNTLQKAVLLDEESSLRNIRLIHKEGDSERVDLLMFFRTSEKKYNPVLQQGDAVHVPPLSLEIGIVSVYGAVKLPGDYEFASGDRLQDLIRISGGFTDDAKLDVVTVVRSAGNSAEYQSFEFNLDGDNPQYDFPLLPDDRIYVSSIPNYHLRQNVIIAGEVLYPGEYSIVEDKSCLSGVIERAGGFTPEANLRDAEIIRKADEEILDPEYERLKLIPVADMTDMEYEYFKTKSREKSIVVVDFHALFNDKETKNDILLRDGDSIHVPMKALTVKVSGQVVNPGLLKWESGKKYDYYLNKAGGYSYNARRSKIRVIKASTGKWIKPNKNTSINVGDTIFVPEKPERDYWAIYKDMMLIVTQMATLVIMVRTLSN